MRKDTAAATWLSPLYALFYGIHPRAGDDAVSALSALTLPEAAKTMLEPPRLIAVSHHADERLWLEVLNLGGFDLLATPFHEVEAGYAIGTAWLDWKYARHQGAHSRRHYIRSDDG